MSKFLAAVSCLAMACQASKPEPSMPVRDPEPSEPSTTAVEASERTEGDASAPEPVSADDVAHQTSRKVAREVAAELDDVAKRPNKLGFTFTDIDEALQAAKTDPKPILMYVRAHWSTDSVEFEHRVLSTAGVRDRLRSSFHSVYVDVTNFDDPADSVISQRFKIVAIPTVVVLDNQGTETDRMSGHIDREAFSSKLKLTR